MVCDDRHRVHRRVEHAHDIGVNRRHAAIVHVKETCRVGLTIAVLRRVTALLHACEVAIGDACEDGRRDRVGGVKKLAV